MQVLSGIGVAAVGVLLMLDAWSMATRASQRWVSLSEPLRDRVRRSEAAASAVATNPDAALRRTRAAWKVFGAILSCAGVAVVISGVVAAS